MIFDANSLCVFMFFDMRTVYVLRKAIANSISVHNRKNHVELGVIQKYRY